MCLLYDKKNICMHALLVYIYATVMYQCFLLQKISPLDYTKLFGEFLDSDVLLRVLCIFKDFYIL